ncbi:MAG: SPFH domain-containing protein [Bacteroidetes bacterium]|nr:SPFH domain-containing protein [Bacteroidota bacterium]
MITPYFILIVTLLVVAAIFFLTLVFSSLLIVGGREIKVLERRWFGKQMPKDRVFAMSNEIGIQARTKGPGLYFLFPFIYSRKHLDFTIIGKDEIGLLISMDGNPIPSGKIFAKPVECNLFQDGEAFLANEGEKGSQIPILPPGIYRINTILFNISKEPVTIIGENQVGIVESIDGAPIPAGRIFGKVVDCDLFQDGASFLENGGEKGPQIKILPPGNYRINTRLFKITAVPITAVEKGQVGVVTSQDGKQISGGRLLAKAVTDHSNFEDGEAFLNKGGEKGPQTSILLPGKYRINTALFKVEIKDTIVIPDKKIGIVVARDGQPLPETEYVAQPVAEHNNFQDVTKFLESGGQRGPQFDVLKPGTYYINPLMFSVELDDVAVVERGQVAVVVSNVGAEPPQVRQITDQIANEEKELSDITTGDTKPLDKRVDVGLERYVVPKGFRGIQQEVAGPGIYYLNRRAYIVYIVDTTNITIDWDDSKETRFDPLRVVSHDGFSINVSVKVVIRVRPDQAPYMVAKIGSIQNLVDHVIHPMIDSSFRNQASATSAMNFMQNRHEEQQKAEDRARAELGKYHVELVSVLICQIQLPEDLMKTQTERIIAQQQQAMYAEQQKAQQSRISMEKTTAEANKQPDLVTSEIDVKVADNLKKKAILLAEGEGESIRLKREGEAKGIEAVGRAEGIAIEAKGSATAQAYEKQKQAIGEQGVIAVQVAEKIAAGNVKIVPDTLITSGEDNGGLGQLVAGFLSKKITGTKQQ